MDHLCVKIVSKDAQTFSPSDLLGISKQVFSCQSAILFKIPSSSPSKFHIHLFMFVPIGSLSNIKHQLCSKFPGYSSNLLIVSFPKDWVRSVQILLDYDPYPQCWGFSRVFLDQLVGSHLIFKNWFSFEELLHLLHCYILNSYCICYICYIYYIRNFLILCLNLSKDNIANLQIYGIWCKLSHKEITLWPCSIDWA